MTRHSRSLRKVQFCCCFIIRHTMWPSCDPPSQLVSANIWIPCIYRWICTHLHTCRLQSAPAGNPHCMHTGRMQKRRSDLLEKPTTAAPMDRLHSTVIYSNPQLCCRQYELKRRILSYRKLDPSNPMVWSGQILGEGLSRLNEDDYGK